MLEIEKTKNLRCRMGEMKSFSSPAILNVNGFAMDDFLDRLLASVDVPPLFLILDIMMLPNENAATDADDADDNLPNMTTRCKAIISVGWEDDILIRVAGLYLG
jgi:hypothetical protein